jgi:hypothetical protein
MGHGFADNMKERSLPIVLMIDRGLSAERRALTDWLRNSRFSTCDAADVFDAIEEMADFTVRDRPDIIVLDVEPGKENAAFVRSVFPSEILKLSRTPAPTGTGDFFEGDLSAVADRLNTLIPEVLTTH